MVIWLLHNSANKRCCGVQLDRESHYLLTLVWFLLLHYGHILQRVRVTVTARASHVLETRLTGKLYSVCDGHWAFLWSFLKGSVDGVHAYVVIRDHCYHIIYMWLQLVYVERLVVLWRETWQCLVLFLACPLEGILGFHRCVTCDIPCVWSLCDVTWHIFHFTRYFSYISAEHAKVTELDTAGQEVLAKVTMVTLTLHVLECTVDHMMVLYVTWSCRSPSACTMVPATLGHSIQDIIWCNRHFAVHFTSQHEWYTMTDISETNCVKSIGLW